MTANIKEYPKWQAEFLGIRFNPKPSEEPNALLRFVQGLLGIRWTKLENPIDVFVKELRTLTNREIEVVKTKRNLGSYIGPVKIASKANTMEEYSKRCAKEVYEQVKDKSGKIQLCFSITAYDDYSWKYYVAFDCVDA